MRFEADVSLITKGIAVSTFFLTVIQEKRLSMFSSFILETILNFSFLRFNSSVLDLVILLATLGENILFMVINFVRIPL